MQHKDLNPSCEFKHCRSFFQLNYTQMKWNKSPIPFEFTTFQFQEVVKIRIEELKNRHLQVFDNYLVYQEQDVTCWIDYENSIIEQINDPRHGPGIRLIKCFDTVEFFSESPQWFKLLKRHTIQGDFEVHYSLQKKVSKGRFTDVTHKINIQVYRAKNLFDGLDYGVKILQKSLIVEEADLISLFKEIKILRLVQTELCVKFYEIFENSENIYIVMELLIGKDLDGHMEKSSFFSEEKTARFIFRLIKTISCLHSKGIMHRDIKPENLVFRQLDNIESACLTDFGLADFYHSEGQYLFKRCGTPGYIAPEILRNEPYDYKVDVYSVGVIMYYVLTGKNPFESVSSRQIVLKNQLGYVDFSNCRLSTNGLQFMKQLLCDDQNERLSSHEALNHQWFQMEKITKIRQYVIKKKTEPNKKPNNISLTKYSEKKIQKQYKSPTFSQSVKISLTQIYSPYHSRQLSHKDQFSNDLSQNFMVSKKINQWASDRVQPLFISKFK